MRSDELINLFFKDLRNYNPTNFTSLLKLDFEHGTYKFYKACSSVVTRYFIFCERHPEIPEEDLKILYYQLGIDMIAKFFSEFPASDVENLKSFQSVLKSHSTGPATKVG